VPVDQDIKLYKDLEAAADRVLESKVTDPDEMAHLSASMQQLRAKRPSAISRRSEFMEPSNKILIVDD
jgi:hypothetical protein